MGLGRVGHARSVAVKQERKAVCLAEEEVDFCDLTTPGPGSTSWGQPQRGHTDCLHFLFCKSESTQQSQKRKRLTRKNILSHLEHSYKSCEWVISASS